MDQSTNEPDDSSGTVSIEKALLADLCLGYPLGRLLFASLPREPLPSGLHTPNTYLFRGEQLAALKHAANTGHTEASAAVEALVSAADKALQSPAPSVTDKPASRFSADPHDYQSLAKYFWPDDAAPDGPWVRRDGDINPECYAADFDYLRLVRLAEDVTLLAVAAYLTGRPEFATGAAHILQRWFLDPATRQNPHFEYSQVAPQGTDSPFKGRGPGVIEARFLIYVTEAVRLLESADLLPHTCADGLREWFGQLLDWMLKSGLGRRAAQAANNIALWHGLQCMVYADFCGRTELAATCLRERIVPQLNRQIAPDGSLPTELDRAHPHDYVVFSVAAMALISRAGEHQGVSLWGQLRADGRNLQAPHDWLLRATQAPALLDRIDRTATPDKATGLGHALDSALRLRAMERAVVELEAQTEELEAERDELAQANAALRNDKEELAHYALRLESLVDSLLTSLSWGVTRPLRTTLRLLRGGDRAENRCDFIPARPAAMAVPGSESPHPDPALDPAPAARESLAKPTRQTIDNQVRLSPEDHLAQLRKARPADERALQTEYRDKGFDRQPDTFVLYRIIGNDLHPRHRIGQSRENLRFILEHEPPLPGCEKRWIVNRIVAPEEELQITELLTSHAQEYIHIPFIAEEYRNIGWDFDALPTPDFLASKAFRELSPEQQDRARIAAYRLKNLYMMNNNGARNTALRDGRDRAKWVLPWDGNCFITAQAWRDIVADVTARPYLKYFAVPMERMLYNADLLRDDYRPNPVEEPQLLFRCDAAEEFNEAFPYGRRPKVELFWRLGIPGSWDRWKDDPWDQPRRAKSEEASQFGVAGWVARMFSGMNELEAADQKSFINRGLKRQQAIVSTLNHTSTLHLSEPSKSSSAFFYTPAALDKLKAALVTGVETPNHALAKRIISDADGFLEKGPYAVTNKSTVAPSGNLQDYWHPAPYWWPNPNTHDGLPYIWRDGQRVPGTKLYERESDKFDRTRVQLMFDGTTALALAWRITGKVVYANHAADYVRAWFINPTTRMNPHLNYAQVRMGHANNNGASTGIIEFKDLYYFLDAVRTLTESNVLTSQQTEQFKSWLDEYLNWLCTSSQGIKECSSRNNHGTYYDLQTFAIAHYLGEKTLLCEIALRALSRIPAQFTESGEQPEEMGRSLTQHYCHFNLQGWINLLIMIQRAGLITCNFSSEPLKRIKDACLWVTTHNRQGWEFQQIEFFDLKRLIPIIQGARALGIPLPSIYDEDFVPSVFDPHHGINPYWRLASLDRVTPPPPSEGDETAGQSIC
ncbi:MAG TPA: alginate lyase family protein [Azoarcus taiwanensis]|nr:alginate lyase family protein [Azoarcus taiwanensis]